MSKLFTAAMVVAGLAFISTASVHAHCGKCEGDTKHKHDHSHGLEAYTKGETKCCSADHYAKTQKKEIAAKDKKEYKKGECCSADHFAAKKVEAAELASAKSAYKKGETKCCSADHYAKKKMAAAKKDK